MSDDERTPVAVSESFLSTINAFKCGSSPTKRASPSKDSETRPVKRRKVDASPSVKEEEKQPVVKGRYKKGQKIGYSSPEKYAHLSPIPDRLSYGLDILWCGINPGVESATTGHAFAHRSNRFWKYVHEGGLSTERLKPSAHATLIETHNMGITNIIPRPTGQAAELAPHEFVLGIPILLDKLLEYRPRILACLGKTIFTTLNSQLLPKSITRKGKSIGKVTSTATSSPHFKPVQSSPVMKAPIVLGFQSIILVYPKKEGKQVEKTFVFALPSPSGLETKYQGAPSVAMYKELAQLSEALQKNPSHQPERHFTEINIAEWLEPYKNQKHTGIA